MVETASYHPRWLATLSCEGLEGIELGGLEGVEILSAVFRAPDIRIVQAPDYTPEGEGKRIYLSSNRFSDANTAEAAKALQSALLHVLNGYCQFVWPGFPKVESNLLIELGPDGEVRERYITTVPDLGILQAGDPILDLLYGDDGAPRGKLSPLPGDVARVLFRQPVRRALAFFGKGAPTWTELYAVLEVIEDSIGGSVVDEGWGSSEDRNVFKRTAQHPDTAGVDARHGAPSEPPPDEPMSLREARNWIREILAKWLRHLAGEEQEGG